MATGKHLYKTKKSGGKTFITLLLLVILIGGGGFILVKHQQNAKEEAQRIELANREVLAKKNAAIEQMNEARRKAALESEEKARLAREAAARRANKNVVSEKSAVEVVELPDEDVVPKKDLVVDDTVPDTDPRLEVFKKKIKSLGADGRSKDAVTTWTQAIDVAIETKRFDKFRDFIENSLKEDTKKLITFGDFKMDRYLDSGMYRNMLFVYRFMELYTPDEIVHMLDLNKDANPEIFFKELFTNENDCLSMLFGSLPDAEEDINLAHVVDTWYHYWNSYDRELNKKYTNLAIAMGLVKSKTVTPSLKDRPAMTDDEVYEYFRNMNEKHMLKTDITKFKPWQLCYVVDVRMPRAEFDWARAEMTKKGVSQKKWGKCYGMVPYRMDKAAGNSSCADMYVEYSFAEILEAGGVCGDQSYFSRNTGKANGIPTACVAGSGRMGGHAWMVFMKDYRDWESSGNIGYTSGKLNDPRTGKAVHENTLLARDKRITPDKLEKTRALVSIFKVLGSMGMTKEAEAALATAQGIAPWHPLAWEATIEYYAKQGEKTTLDKWMSLVNTLRTKFRDDPDYLQIAQRVEDEYVYPLRDADENLKAAKRSLRRVEKTTDEGRTDLSLMALQKQAEAYIKAKNFEALPNVYMRIFKEYGERTDAMQQIVSQYFSLVKQHAPDQMLKAAQMMERAYNRYVDDGSDNLFMARMQVGIQRQIAGFYEEAGDKKMADRLRDKAQKREDKVVKREKEDKSKNRMTSIRRKKAGITSEEEYAAKYHSEGAPSGEESSSDQ